MDRQQLIVRVRPRLTDVIKWGTSDTFLNYREQIVILIADIGNDNFIVANLFERELSKDKNPLSEPVSERPDVIKDTWISFCVKTSYSGNTLGMELRCALQTYDWGKLGTDSTVATLMKTANSNFLLDEQKPYAELWMGTHPNGPSFLKDSNVSLQSYIEGNKGVLGTAVEKNFGSTLPFLFKVLSVKKALSIQVHPNKDEARRLNERYPDIYKDSNHKPELAIALTPFEALCGFRPAKEIKDYFEALPELRSVVGEDKALELTRTTDSEFPRTLKECFRALMTRNPGLIASQLRKLLDRLSKLDDATRQALNAPLLERLYTDYPGDVGCFGIYLFNCITMQPGEAIYLGPNEPHAYLSGDCIECMACSDNVIRAGLTPKLKDVPTLIEMLTYNCEPASTKRFQPSRDDDCTEVFHPPVPDFAVAKITIPPGRASYDLIPRTTASILIIINGKGEISSSKVLHRGSIVFIAANERLGIKVLCGCHPMLMFQAFANV